MAQKGVHLDQGTFSCLICGDLLKDPVTIPCGHSYCLRCVQTHWDMERVHSCPQCSQTFTPRPVLVKNAMLEHVVDQLKKTVPETSVVAEDSCDAGAEDVACDTCTGGNLNAVKSCLMCWVSDCCKHLHRRRNVPQCKKYEIADPLEDLHVDICPRHGEAMRMFCRTDRQGICYLCSTCEHKNHDAVLAAAERTEKQTELEASRHKIRRRIKDKQEEVEVLRWEADDFSRSADEAVEKSNRILTEMIQLMRARRCDVNQQIRSRELNEMSRVKELEWKLEQEMIELRRRDAEMDQLSRTGDHNQFLFQYPLVSRLGQGPDSPGIQHVHPLRNFEDLTTGVLELRDKLQHSLTKDWTHISLTIAHPQDPSVQPVPETRAGFLQYSREITLDPNTANGYLFLSEDSKRVTATRVYNDYSNHPGRFVKGCQVLSRERLTGRCYWEVKWRGEDIHVAVAYKDIKRKGLSHESLFGFNKKSWALYSDGNTPVFLFNSVDTPVPGPLPSRIGVYLDHTAGILSFYKVREPMTLIHRVETTFTQPLHAGLGLWNNGVTAHFPKLR